MKVFSDTTIQVIRSYVKLLFGEWAAFGGWTAKVLTLALGGGAFAIDWRLAAGLFIGFLVGLILIAPFREHEKEKSRRKLTERQLPIRVLGGTRINSADEEFTYIPTLVLDLVNNSEQKIVELEAQLVRVTRWREIHSSREEGADGVPISGLLQWRTGETRVELRPGFPEVKVCLAILRPDDNNLSFFIKPGHPNIETLHFEAIYEVLIEFKGKLEGESKFLSSYHVAEFFCSPQSDKLEFTDTAIRLDEVPESLKKFVRHGMEAE